MPSSPRLARRSSDNILPMVLFAFLESRTHVFKRLPLRVSSVLVILALFIPAHVVARTPTQDGLVYGTAAGEKLTMDYYAPKGRPRHPIAIIIHGGGFIAGTSKNGSEAYCADFLAPAGYAVFSINYRLAPKYPYPAMVHDVQRAIRYIRYHARAWDADPNKIALVGGSAGGYLSNMVGLLNAPGIKDSDDPVERESAQVQAVVTLFGPSDFRKQPLNENTHALLDAYIAQKGETEALAEASPITHVSNTAPPFLLIHGDKDEMVAFTESTNLQHALQAEGIRCDLIRIPNGPHATGSWYKVPGVPDWERQMTEWLNSVLGHKGEVGEGIHPRMPQH
jgi:acetyl esterase